MVRVGNDSTLQVNSVLPGSGIRLNSYLRLSFKRADSYRVGPEEVFK
jgi:hypothetical protein